MQRAEKAATSLVKDVLEARVKARERREELENELAAKEEERENVLMKGNKNLWSQ